MNYSESVVREFKEYLEKIVFTNIYPPPTAKSIKSKCQRPRDLKLQNDQETNAEDDASCGGYEVVIYSTDRRKRRFTTEKWPDSVHGVITGKFKDENFQGTGILIGPNVVLTAGHNLYWYHEDCFADPKSMRFLPGVNAKNRPFGEVEVEKYFTNFAKERNEDYGILILKESIGDLTGYFGLACLEPAELDSKKINVLGYPEEKGKPESGEYEMWGMEGTLSRVDTLQGYICYKIDTTKGQSGSGAFYEENGEYFVFGVHVRGFKEEKENTATLLTRSRYQQIYVWIQENVKREWLFFLRNEVRSLIFESHFVNANCISLLYEYNLNQVTALWFVSKAGGNRIRCDGLKALAKNTSWINLSELNFVANRIDAEGAKELAQNTSWINLSQLDLSDNQIGNEGAKGLAQNVSWINLSQLNLSNNQIDNEGAKELAQNTSWINLSQLDLSNNYIDAEGVQGLAQNTSWINLSQLILTHNKIDYEGVLKLLNNKSCCSSLLYLNREDIRTLSKFLRSKLSPVLYPHHLIMTEEVNPDPSFSNDRQIDIQVKGLAPSSFAFNFNSSNLSAELVQLSLENLDDQSSNETTKRVNTPEFF